MQPGRVPHHLIPARRGPPGRHNGNTWVQRAAVDGYATTGALSALRTSAAAIPLIIVATRAGGQETRICVTMDGERESTWFGGADPDAFSMCHQDAVAAVRTVWQVAIIDPEWGRNTILWSVLSDFATRRGHAPEGCRLSAATQPGDAGSEFGAATDRDFND